MGHSAYTEKIMILCLTFAHAAILDFAEIHPFTYLCYSNEEHNVKCQKGMESNGDVRLVRVLGWQFLQRFLGLGPGFGGLNYFCVATTVPLPFGLMLGICIKVMVWNALEFLLSHIT